jgi:hypothetical protein
MARDVRRLKKPGEQALPGQSGTLGEVHVAEGVTVELAEWH